MSWSSYKTSCRMFLTSGALNEYENLELKRNHLKDKRKTKSQERQLDRRTALDTETQFLTPNSQAILFFSSDFSPRSRFKPVGKPTS